MFVFGIDIVLIFATDYSNYGGVQLHKKDNRTMWGNPRQGV